MALIKCPECGKEISDKSDKCIHCGYPIKESVLCIINGIECNLSFIFDESIHKGKRVSMLRQLCNCGLKTAADTVNEIIRTQKIPKILNLAIEDQLKVENNITKCPKCGSTNIQIVPRKWSLLTGFLTNKTDRVCVNCKHKF